MQEPEKKPQESVIQEREQGKGQEQGQKQVQERPTQEEEQVNEQFGSWKVFQSVANSTFICPLMWDKS